MSLITNNYLQVIIFLNVFLITPQTSEERILKIDKITNAFIYVVASSSITGAKGEISSKQIAYFERIKK